MARTLELHLESLHCLHQSERDGDEIYVTFVVEPVQPHGVKPVPLATERVPAEHWKMKTGDVVQVQHLLYLGEVVHEIRAIVTVMEMDILQLIKNSLSIVGTWVDDFVGKVDLHLGPEGLPRWDLGRHSHPGQPLAGEPDIHEYRLTGNKSEYLLRLRVKIH